MTHFTSREIEAQGCDVACLWSQSKLASKLKLIDLDKVSLVTGLELEDLIPDPVLCSFQHHGVSCWQSALR